MPLFSIQNTTQPPPPPQPLQPLPTVLQRTLLQILLQTLILLVLLTILTFSITFTTCFHLGFEGFYPSAQIFFSIAISLVWFLPLYFITTVVGPILRRYSKIKNKNKKSSSTSLRKHGRRPLWLSYKERCLLITIPAVVILALSTSTVVENAPNLETWQYKQDPYDKKCYIWQPQPLFTLAFSLLALVEAFITFRLDNKAHLQEQELEKKDYERKHRHPQPTANCGNLFCLHRCVSTLTNSNLESPPPSPSTPSVQVPITYCTSLRLIRNFRVLATFTGTICIVTIVPMVSHDQYNLLERFRRGLSLLGEILAMAFACGLWLIIVYDMFQPSTTRIAHHLRPKTRVFITFCPGFLLALWTIAETIRTTMNKEDVAGDRGWNSRLGYTISGAVFGTVMVVEAVMTFLFDRRRYNTARKVKAFQEQQELRRQEQLQLQLEQLDATANAGIELGGADGKFQESGLFEGKIEV